jgi:hypothetical protein
MATMSTGKTSTGERRGFVFAVTTSLAAHPTLQVSLRAAGLRDFRFNDLRYADYEPQKGGSGTVDDAFS